MEVKFYLTKVCFWFIAALSMRGKHTLQDSEKVLITINVESSCHIDQLNNAVYTGADANSTDNQGNTLLHFIATSDNLIAAEELFLNGTSSNQLDMTIFLLDFILRSMLRSPN